LSTGLCCLSRLVEIVVPVATENIMAPHALPIDISERDAEQWPLLPAKVRGIVDPVATANMMAPQAPPTDI